MSARTQTHGTSHTRFMQAVNDELNKFEFRRKDHDERAKRLLMPVEKYDAGDPRIAKLSRNQTSLEGRVTHSRSG